MDLKQKTSENVEVVEENLNTEQVENNSDVVEIGEDKKENNLNEEQSTQQKELNEEEDSIIQLTKKELQSKLDSFSDKKINTVLSKKNDELEQLKLKLKDYEQTSADDFKNKIVEKSKKELEEQYSELEKNLKEKEDYLKEKELEIEKLSKEFSHKLDIQSTQEQLKLLDLPTSLAEELVNKYGDNKSAITKRINVLKEEYDEKHREVINSKIALNNPKLQNNLDTKQKNEVNYSNISDIIRSIKKNKK